jgi:aspartyl-tRNA synthetase
MLRSHHCAQLTRADVGKTVTLAGWVDTIRDQGGILFVDLRDREGVTQLRLERTQKPELAATAHHLKAE